MATTTDTDQDAAATAAVAALGGYGPPTTSDRLRSGPRPPLDPEILKSIAPPPTFGGAPPAPAAPPAEPGAPMPPDESARTPLLTRQQELLKREERIAGEKSEALAPFRQEALQDTQKPLPMPPKPPELPAAPSAQLHPMYTTSAGPDGKPINPGKMLQDFMGALTTFASAIGGVASGSARASLAAIVGANEGWMAGDQERVRRDFAEWDAKTRQLLNLHQLQQQNYQSVLANSKLSLDQKLNAMAIIAAPFDDAMTITQAQQKQLDATLKEFDRRQEVYAKLKQQYDQMILRHEDATVQRQMMEHLREGDQELKRLIAEWQHEDRQRALEEKKAGKDEKRQNSLNVMETNVNQMETRAMRLRDKGFFPRDSGKYEKERAAVKRGEGHLFIPGYSEPNDPDWRAWKQDVSYVVGFARSVQNDIGARAMKAFEQLFEAVLDPPTWEGLKQIFDQQRQQLEAARSGKVTVEAPPGAWTPGGKPTRVDRIERID